MKKFLYVIAAVALTVSCDILHLPLDEPAEFEPVTMEANTTIAELKAMYKKSGNPVNIEADVLIAGQVISSDESGNIYKSIYIQDETGAIEVKIGRTSLYSDYKLGQWIYVACKGLTVGEYGGMLQLGFRDDSGEYETAYLESQYLVDAHVFKGALSEPVTPLLIDEAGIRNPANFGKLVRVEGLTYKGVIFVILYDKNDNSIYLSDKGNYGIESWAMTKNGFKAHMTANGKVEPQSAFDGAITKENWQAYYDAATAYSVSQYFQIGKSDLQVRTSGYAKFADTKIDAGILAGARVDLQGLLTYYNGNYQFVLIDLDGVHIAR